MSQKIKDQLDDSSKKFQLSETEANLLVMLDTYKRSLNYYLDQLGKAISMDIATRFGYKASDDLEFSTDLRDKNHEVTITKLKANLTEPKSED